MTKLAEQQQRRKAKNSGTKISVQNLKIARQRWPDLQKFTLISLKRYSDEYGFSLASSDLILLERRWYVTHTGLVRLAARKRCAGIQIQPVSEFSDLATSRWAFKATVYKSSTCKGFVGYGDADPSNTSELVRGAEMRVAETRAVNRALRKAYGIGICSVEEIGPFSGSPASDDNHRKHPPQPLGGNGANGHRLRDRLCQLIRQHELDPVLVKSYAVDFCGVKTLKEASREQVKNFIDHVADWADKDKNALVCQLNGYMGKQESVA